jgi:DNA phosphorothioation-dependent restriction protein DptG
VAQSTELLISKLALAVQFFTFLIVLSLVLSFCAYRVQPEPTEQPHELSRTTTSRV